MRVERKKNERFKKTKIFLCLICVAVFIGSISLAGFNYFKARASQKAAEALADLFYEQIQLQKDQLSQNTNTATEEDENNENEDEIHAPEPAPFILDFNVLQNINSEIIGWLSVEGTRIEYPILYSPTDREYYLHHNYLNEYDNQGSIFVEYFNEPDFTDWNTILYGHSMLNGNMFRSIHYFSDGGFFNTYGKITVYTPYGNYIYQVFEAITLDNSHIFSYLDNSSRKSIENFIAEMTAKPGANIKYEYLPTADDKIITMSTCTTSDRNRMVVFAKLVSVESVSVEVESSDSVPLEGETGGNNE